MIGRNPRGDWPEVAESAFIDPTAIICGRVSVEDDVFIGPYAVFRADETNESGHIEWIRIGHGSNLQDGVVIHSKSGAAVTIGSRTSVAHRSIVHGPCRIGDNVFIGFNSVLFNCAPSAMALSSVTTPRSKAAIFRQGFMSPPRRAFLPTWTWATSRRSRPTSARSPKT